MRRILVSLATATALATAAALAPVHAVTPGAATAIEAALADTRQLDEAAYVCRHRPHTSRRVCWWRPGPYNWRWQPWRRWRKS
jgi:hypothetical protein